MTDQPTPETDAMFTENVPDDCQIVAFCERLERERNAARAALDLIATPMRIDGTYTIGRDECGYIARKALAPETAAKLADDPHPPHDWPDYARALEIQRNEARAERDDYHRKACDIADQRDQLRAERDRLLSELADERAKKSDALIAAVDDLERLTAERDRARAERDRARAERDESWAENERLRSAHARGADVVRLRAALEGMMEAEMALNQAEGWSARDVESAPHWKAAREALATSAK